MITCILVVCTLSFIYLLHKIFINSNTQKYYACFSYSLSRSLSLSVVVLLVVSKLQHIRHNRDKYTREKSHFSLSRLSRKKKEKKRETNLNEKYVYCSAEGWLRARRSRSKREIWCVFNAADERNNPNIPAEDAWCMDLDEKCWNPFLFPAICQTVLYFSIFPLSPHRFHISLCRNLTCTQQR